MTKELLEQYPDICAEIEELKAKDSAAVSDVVQASADEFPFNLHSVTVQGLPNPKHAERIRELEVQKAEIEAFVGRLAYRPQKLARCVMKHGTRWKVIMREMGGFPRAFRAQYPGKWGTAGSSARGQRICSPRLRTLLQCALPAARLFR